MNRRTRFLFLIPSVLVGVPVWLTWRAVRQERLDRALIVAVKKNNGRQAVALLAQGADANAHDNGEIPSSFRRQIRLLFCRFGHIACLNEGAGPSALMLAVDAENPKTATLLLDKGADVNARDANGMTALRYAAFSAGCSEVLEVNCKDHIEIIRLLLARGAEVNDRADDGWTPLMKAVKGGDAKIVKALLTKHADVNIADQQGETALTLAKDLKRAYTDETVGNHMIQMLKQAGAKE